jgi:hypothetical protein
VPTALRKGPVSAAFQFRFVVRGSETMRAVNCATASLRRCHPQAAIVVIDANDSPLVDPAQLPPRCLLVHLVPGDDDVARAVGRGSRKHLFYWRHSPQVLASIGINARYDVHADADMLFLRPMDLGSLEPQLRAGRIAMAIDRATIEYYRQLESLSAEANSRSFPVAGSRGPMVQGGLLFRNPEDDGGLLDQMWNLACEEARVGALDRVPWDDMAFLTNLLSQAGPLWGRLLALGHEWNYISDEGLGPGVFGYVAHYAGRDELKGFMAREFSRRFPPVDGLGPVYLWQREPDIVCVGYGRVGLAGEAGYDGLGVLVDGKRIRDSLSMHPPFSATWHVPDGATEFAFTSALSDTSRNGDQEHRGMRLLCYGDGRLITDCYVRRGEPQHVCFPVDGLECVTLIGTTSQFDYCHFILRRPCWTGQAN